MFDKLKLNPEQLEKKVKSASAFLLKNAIPYRLEDGAFFTVYEMELALHLPRGIAFVLARNDDVLPIPPLPVRMIRKGPLNHVVCLVKDFPDWVKKVQPDTRSGDCQTLMRNMIRKTNKRGSRIDGYPSKANLEFLAQFDFKTLGSTNAISSQ